MENIWTGIVIPYANFILFLALAYHFFRKPVTAAAQKKRQDFEAAKAEAERARNEAVEALQKLEARMANLQTEIDDIRNSAKAAADHEAERIVSGAKELAQHLEDEAKRIAANEVEKARHELRVEVIRQAKESVASKIKNELGAEEHGRLMQDRIGKLKEVGAVN